MIKDGTAMGCKVIHEVAWKPLFLPLFLFWFLLIFAKLKSTQSISFFKTAGVKVFQLGMEQFT